MSPKDCRDSIEKSVDVLDIFTTLALGSVSKDARDAKDLGYLNISDIITESSNIIDFAKQKALDLAANSYSPSNNVSIPILGSGVRNQLM